MRTTLIAIALVASMAACGGDEENTGSSCETVDDCYADVDHALIQGEVQCLDRVESGYCTHLCTTDADCCAAEDECETGIAQVCSPFENDTTTRCFLSCEASEIGEYEENEYCQEFAHPDFQCRSSGGGTTNRKICVPAA